MPPLAVPSSDVLSGHASNLVEYAAHKQILALCTHGEDLHRGAIWDLPRNGGPRLAIPPGDSVRRNAIDLAESPRSDQLALVDREFKNFLIESIALRCPGPPIPRCYVPRIDPAQSAERAPNVQSVVVDH